LPNVGPYIYDVSISGFTRSSIYIYDISSLRVKEGAANDFLRLVDMHHIQQKRSLLVELVCVERADGKCLGAVVR